MTWTYSSSTSNLDQVRVLIGDTDSTDQVWSDEQINSSLTIAGGDVVQASKRLVAGKAAEYARRAVSKKAGQYSEDLKARHQALLAILDSLNSMSAEPYEEIAEQTHGEASEKEFLKNEDIREG